MKRASLWLWMIAAIALVCTASWWDARRESDALPADLAANEAPAARAVALTLGAAKDEASLAVALRGIDLGGDVRAFARVHGSLVGNGAPPPRIGAIEDAFTEGASWAKLSRPEALALGLPERTAVCALARVDADGALASHAVIVASAARARDHELRAQYRLVASVALGSGLVLAFGIAALRRQRTELELSRELAVAEIRRDRDERLVRADKLATMGALATGIAHEVSTPLAVIVGRAEQLAPKVEADPRSKRAVLAILEHAERIHVIVRGILGLARGGAPTLVRVSPREIAVKAKDLVDHRFEQAGARLEVSIDDSLPDVACDPRLFEQVIVNLLLNACDAAGEHGAVTLHASREKNGVAFSVTDDGPGITKEDAARATEPFFTTKPEGKGTGLGLAIANEIVKHHRGVLRIGPKSDGRGTRAVATLPPATLDLANDDAREEGEKGG